MMDDGASYVLTGQIVVRLVIGAAMLYVGGVALAIWCLWRPRR